jgi:N-methylhydantoinase A/oxoprolinase/acetone carboxylase beta subunit
MKNFVLALDTGGTNTDAVILDTYSNSIIASAKAYTTHHDLSIGIVGDLRGLNEKCNLQSISSSIRSINLSTTLATNAIAEGQGHRVGLIMIGFDANQEIVRDNLERLPAVSPIFISGGHDYYGRQEQPLDEEELLEKVSQIGNSVSAWAVSGFFSIKNPAHELKVAQLVKSRFNQPITLGRSLSGELGAMRRAATAALNAGLVVIVNRLLDAVVKGSRELGLEAPIMIVKGDGGLVGEQWARARPIETVVSGPAAGLVGAMKLSSGFLDPSQKDLWVLDVGGTTSDLAYLKDGRPAISINGAKVGQWHTMVEAVDTFTRGLGGDSLVEVDVTGQIVIGPRRVLPLCRLAEMYPDTIKEAAKTELGDSRNYREGMMTFFIPNLPPGPEMGEDETEILKLLAQKKPLQLAAYQKYCLDNDRLFAGLKVLSHPAILVSGFTPTDAMNVLGLFNTGSRPMSLMAAERLAMRFGCNPFDFCRAVLDKVGKTLAEDIISVALSREGVKHQPADFADDQVLGNLVSLKNLKILEMNIKVVDPIIVLGAPAGVLAPFIAKHSRGAVLAPPGCQVASALGAAASTVSLVRKVDIVTLPDFSGYRAFLPDGILDDLKMEVLIDRTCAFMEDHMNSLAKLAGSEEECSISFSRIDREARLADGARLIMGATLTYTIQGLEPIQADPQRVLN